MIVYLNGNFTDASQATLSPDDRGFLFADGVYEVARIYAGRPFLMDEHMRRMRDGLAALMIDDAVIADIPAIADRLIRENSLQDAEGTIYVQVTRGAAPRKHAFPQGVSPTVYVVAKPFKLHPPEYFTHGVAAITVADNRWARCDIKSIALLPNVIANNAAHERGAFEALYVKDGVLIEGSHSNLFGVIDNMLVTYPRSNYILGGITRDLVIRLARESDVLVKEAPIYFDRIRDVTELFLSGTTTEIMPVTTLDDAPVGDGMPGPLTRRMQELFATHIRSAS